MGEHLCRYDYLLIPPNVVLPTCIDRVYLPLISTYARRHTSKILHSGIGKFQHFLNVTEYFRMMQTIKHQIQLSRSTISFTECVIISFLYNSPFTTTRLSYPYFPTFLTLTLSFMFVFSFYSPTILYILCSPTIVKLYVCCILNNNAMSFCIRTEKHLYMRAFLLIYSHNLHNVIKFALGKIYNTQKCYTIFSMLQMLIFFTLFISNDGRWILSKSIH